MTGARARGRALSVQGTSSWAGKSLLTAGLCRLYARRGVDVVPFKAQNMSNNARVVRGGEIGVAQYVQAVAARAVPEVDMNPVLVKPESDDRSQVVIHGVADLDLSAMAWRERGPLLWDKARESLDRLMADHALVVCEGAGSPAETNLLDTDLSNMRVAEYTAAPVILIGDIDRGGVFAHLFGTWSLVGDRHRDRIAGFVLNKFRGDPSLLAPAPRDLEALTGVPVLGVVPMLRHHVPDEDGADPDRGRGAGDGPVVAVVRGPFASNLDEFSLLGQVCRLRWAQRPADLDGADLVVIPGSKHTMADRDWMRERGLDRAVVEAWRRGERIVGVCGGLQILGGELSDPCGIETAGRGLGLLPVSTVLDRHKRVDPIRTSFAAMPLPWEALSGLSIDGYQIRHGVSTAAAPLHEALPHGLGWVEANLLAVYVHGMFEMPSVLRALVGRAPTRTLDDELDTVADALEAHVDLSSVDRLLGW